MTLQYFSKADMLYIKFAETVSTESEEVSPGVVLDFNENKHVVGIEIEDASKLIDLSRLEVFAMPLSNLVLSEKEPTKV